MEFIERETKNVKETMNEVSKDLGFPVEFVDFDILEENTSKDEYGNIVKKYSVKYFVNENKSVLYNIMRIKTDNSDAAQRAYIVVNNQGLKSNIDISEDEIVEVIKKNLILNNIVFGVKENIFSAVAKEIKKRLNPSCKPFKILIAEGRKPINGKNSELRYFFNRYQAAGSITKDGKIDYKKKNFLVPISENSVLIEFKKPQMGREGYDIYGHIIHQDIGVVIEDIDDIKFNAESIKKIEEDDVVRLVSKKNGVIIFKNGVYDIDVSVSIDKVDIKTTGNLDANNDVELNIGSSGGDSVEDTIAAGLKVKAKKVSVNGDVGPQAVVEADEVIIKGSVHQDATIIAKKATISICRGTVYADDVEIDLAEHAKIISRNSTVINRSVASKIYCPKIEIKDSMMASNVTTSSESIVINNIEGNNNIIAIQPLNLPWIKEKYKELYGKKKYGSVALKVVQKKYDNALSAVNREKGRYDNALKAIQVLKEEKKDVPKPLLLIVKKFKECTDDLQKAKEEYKNAQDELENIESSIKEMENSYKKGHIIVNGRISSGNKIVFDDSLSRIIEKAQNNVKIYVRDIQGKETIVIEQNNDA